MEQGETNSEKTRKYIQNSVVSYLWQEPYCTLSWMKKVIRDSSIPSTDLKRVFRNLVTEYGDKKRFRKLFDACRKAHFNYRLVE